MHPVLTIAYELFYALRTQHEGSDAVKQIGRTLEQKLSLGVATGLGLLAVIAGITTATFAYRQEIAASRDLQKQLIEVVRAQVEVAVFAQNREIANGVIDGLLVNPTIQAVRIKAKQGFSASGGDVAALADPLAITSYPLHSPADSTDEIGQIEVVLNPEQLKKKAALATLILLANIALQVILAAVLIVWLSRRVIVRPITELAAHISQIEPGSGVRVAIPDRHKDDEIGQLSSSTNRLIDAHEKALAELRELATTDVLTGVSTRRQFMRRMTDELVRIQRVESQHASVLMLDIDHFKKINDTYGHPTGDAALYQLGTIFRSIARRIDVVGRLGGEEFAILLVGADAQEATTFAERLRTTVSDTTVVYGSLEFHMTLSIGVATLSATDDSPDAPLARADKALYEAKSQGRNCVIVAEEQRGL